MAKWCFLPYDFDTGIGTNNEGALAFSYELEDIDKLAGADVFNGQNSVLWKNLRQAYFDKIKQMYQELRSQGKLSYDDTERRFEEHQAVWSEAIFNEDSYFKYLAPLIDDNTSAYLSMLQGSKAEQRKWWLYNRFRYIDSKYNAGDALTDVITIRGYAKSDITVTPYADIYASVKYGSYLTQMRALRGNSYTLKCPLDNVNDTEIYIYSASQLKDVGDLSGLKIGYAEFSLATKLQAIKIGDADESYANPNLTELHLGNNTLLRKLDVRNCPNLVQTVDISGCSNVEFVYFDGTSVAGILLPSAGILKELHLPATITNLTIRNQPSLYDLTVPDYSKITTLRLENVNKVVDSKAILKAIPANSRVRLLGIDWTAEDADDLMSLIALLDTMRGLDENGNNLDTAQVSGTISVDTVTGAQVAEVQSKYPDIKIAYQHITSFLYFYNDTGTTLLYTQSITDGADGVYSASTPSKSSTAQYTYSFAGWSKKPGGSADSTALKAVVADRNVYAAFTATVRRYTVYFYNGSTLLQKVENVAYGSSATYTGDTPVSSEGSAEDYPFLGFVPDGKNITGNTSCYAQFGSPYEFTEITDSWDEICTSIDDKSYRTKYKLGNYKSLTLTYKSDTISGTSYSSTFKLMLAGIDVNYDDIDDNNIPLEFISVNPYYNSVDFKISGDGTIDNPLLFSKLTNIVDYNNEYQMQSMRSNLSTIMQAHIEKKYKRKSFSLVASEIVLDTDNLYKTKYKIVPTITDENRLLDVLTVEQAVKHRTAIAKIATSKKDCTLRLLSTTETLSYTSIFVEKNDFLASERLKYNFLTYRQASNVINRSLYIGQNNYIVPVLNLREVKKND